MFTHQASVDAPARPARPASEFADLVPQLDRLSALPPDDPERAVLRDRLVVALLPVGERIASRHARSSPWAREDLRQVAAVGVINAVDRWDPVRADGADVLAFLVPSVRGEILRWFRDRTWSMRVPRRLKELSVSIHGLSGPLAQELGRAPRPSELARSLGVDVEEVVEALRAEQNRHATSLDATGSDEAGDSVGDRIGEDDPLLAGVEDSQALHIVLADLPDRERRIVLLRFYGGQTQSQIAAELGISQMHVSRLLTAILARLRRALFEDPDE